MTPAAASLEFDVITRLGPLHALAEPVMPRGPHPFLLVDGKPTCGCCQGGILHPIHAAQHKEEMCPRPSNCDKTARACSTALYQSGPGDAHRQNARQKFWSELSIEEKIERCRQMIKNLQAEIHVRMEDALVELQALRRQFPEHTHSNLGQCVVPATAQREANGYGHKYPDTIGKAEDPDKVYF